MVLGALGIEEVGNFDGRRRVRITHFGDRHIGSVVSSGIGSCCEFLVDLTEETVTCSS